MTYQSTVRRLTLVTAILVAIALTLFLTAPFAKGIHWPKLVLRTTRPRERPPSAEVQVAGTLPAGTSGIEDADGMDYAEFGHQWLADGSDIAGVTAST